LEEYFRHLVDMSLRKSKSVKLESKGRSQSVISPNAPLWRSPSGAPPLPLDSPPTPIKKKVRKDKVLFLAFNGLNFH
jgi:hypothetical protein